MMLSCERAASLIDKKSEVKLSCKENLQLSMHNSVCKSCDAYSKQTVLIEQYLSKHFLSESNSELPIIENEPLKKKITSKL